MQKREKLQQVFDHFKLLFY